MKKEKEQYFGAVIFDCFVYFLLFFIIFEILLSILDIFNTIEKYIFYFEIILDALFLCAFLCRDYLSIGNKLAKIDYNQNLSLIRMIKKNIFLAISVFIGFSCSTFFLNTKPPWYIIQYSFPLSLSIFLLDHIFSIGLRFAGISLKTVESLPKSQNQPK